MLIDTHCHLSYNDYSDLDSVIKKMDSGVMITNGVDSNSNHEVIDICGKYANVYGTLGIHPENVDNVFDDDFLFIEKHISDLKIVGIGEIGLDYHFRSDNKEKQKEVFIRQLLLAQKYNKPVVIHSRDAILDTYNILKDLKLTIPVDIHCFSSSLEMAREFIKLGCNLGIGGVLTFKNSDKLKEIVKCIDLKYLLLETDSPYLSPEPFRGCQNMPSNVYYVASKIAEIKGISVDSVIYETNKNAVRMFDLKI